MPYKLECHISFASSSHSLFVTGAFCLRTTFKRKGFPPDLNFLVILLTSRGMELENVIHVGSSTCPLKEIIREVFSHLLHTSRIILICWCVETMSRKSNSLKLLASPWWLSNVETRSRREAQGTGVQTRTVWSKPRWTQSGKNNLFNSCYSLFYIFSFLLLTI